MNDGIHGETLPLVLLNSLEAERYVRGALMLTLLDELSVRPGFEQAAALASRILARLEAGPIDDGELRRGLVELRASIASAPSGLRPSAA